MDEPLFFTLPKREKRNLLWTKKYDYPDTINGWKNGQKKNAKYSKIY
ncbi:hypothetical protein B4114_3134 [Geobacillus stearothermophilus]|uniref:Uncharacterized protein n=1 Tax=Geobacillus stearothermophilus TaxID=1422 RepID=A0A150N647_GEOSE|nr:hypothetical protein B4114_3134 [Geobacillus stearothermophilus]